MAVVIKSIADLNALEKTMARVLQDSYQNGLKDPFNWVNGMFTQVDSVDDAITNIFYGSVGDPTRVLGPGSINYSTLMGSSYEFRKHQYKNGIKIDVHDFLADKVGFLPEMVRSIADKYASIYRIEAVDILNNGATSAVLTADGVPLFDNAHVYGLGSFDNLLAGTNNFRTDLIAMIQAMAGFADDQGLKRWNNVPTDFIVPQSIMFETREVLDSPNDPRDNKNFTNVLQGAGRAWIEPRLTDTNDWFGIVNNPGEKPFIAVRHPVLDNPTLIPDMDVRAENIMAFEYFSWRIQAERALFPTWAHLFAKNVNP
jgi:hypothetical protein